MKKIILTLVLSVLGLSTIFAQAKDLFFSEYIEGSSNNKAIEIFNGTGASVDLTQYLIAQSVNGGGWQYYHEFAPGQTIADGDVFVLLNSEVADTLFSAADADTVLSYPSAVHHNGDDARALLKVVGQDTIMLDVIGIPTEDPGSAWEVAGVTNATANHTLVRKSSVTEGDTSWVTAAGTDSASSEWLVYPQDDFSHLGSHTMDAVVPVELTSFTAAVENNNISLRWKTATEKNNRGFNIERKADNQNKWVKIAFVEGNGTTTKSNFYSYSDKNLNAGQYSYRLRQVDFDGSYEFSKVVEAVVANPITFDLAQNYPNPFNPSTTIKFSMPEAGNVALKVFNVLGQQVKTLVNGFMEAGVHTVNFNAVNLNSGIYFYKLETQNFNMVKKMMLTK